MYVVCWNFLLVLLKFSVRNTSATRSPVTKHCSVTISLGIIFEHWEYFVWYQNVFWNSPHTSWKSDQYKYNTGADPRIGKSNEERDKRALRCVIIHISYETCVCCNLHRWSRAAVWGNCWRAEGPADSHSHRFAHLPSPGCSWTHPGIPAVLASPASGQ